MMKNQIISFIKRIEELSKKLLQTKENEIKDKELENYFCKLEKIRMDMYDAVRQENIFINFIDDKGIEIIDHAYKAKLEDGVLKIFIPEKIPSIKK